MKFIHIADLHLGSSFLSASFDKDIAKQRREDLFKAFNKVILACKKREVDLLLIAGDLFEDSKVKASDVNRIIDGFKLIPDVEIVIVGGNHDYIHEKSFYKTLHFPKNVTIFESDELEMVEFEELNTCVYGLSFNEKHYSENILQMPSIDENKNNILLLHCDVLTNSDYLPIEKEILEEGEFDYYALGHIHKSSMILNNAVYPGSLEPLDFSEQGVHGYIYGEINEDKKLNIKLIKSSIRQFVELKMDISDMTSLEDIISLLTKQLGENKDKFLYRINMHGTLNDLINMEDVKLRLNEEFYYAEVIDNTTKDYNIPKIYSENRDNIIGQFIKTLKNSEGSVNEDALYLGLEALLGEEER